MNTYCPRCGSGDTASALGEALEGSGSCAACSFPSAEGPLMLATGNAEDEVRYDLGEWEPEERVAATAALLDVDIPYRWEDALVLVVPAVAEAEVDRLLDDLDPDDVDDEDDGADGGEEAQQAMTELFVAADRMQHAPGDDGVVAEVIGAAATVGASLPPYGIERLVWKRIQGLAATLVTDLEEAVDDGTVAADARALREYLRDLV